jgi:hypothetical protein
LLFNVLAMAAESESDLIRMRKGMQIDKAKGDTVHRRSAWRALPSRFHLRILIGGHDLRAARGRVRRADPGRG